MNFLKVFFLFTSFCFLAGCNSSNTGVSGNFTAYSYTGSGSNTNWRMVLNATGAFVAIESNTNTTVLGTYTRNAASGFVIIIITSAQGSAAPTTLPMTVLGLELGGVAFVMQPILPTENALITSVLSGNCPGNSLANNYIFTQFNSTDNMTVATKGFFGTASYLQSNGTVASPTYYTLNSGYPVASAGFATSSGICNNGVALLTNQASNYVMAFASFIKFNSGGDTSALISIPAQTLSVMTSLSGNYAGLVYDSVTAKVFPIQTVLTPAGASAPLSLSDVNTTDYLTPNGTTYATMTLNSVDSPSAGFVPGTIGGGNVMCIGESGFVGRNSLFCVGQNPSGTTKPVVVVLMSR